MNSKLEQAVQHLVQQVLTYECDVFSSKDYVLSKDEAEQAAAELIYNHMFDRNSVYHLDGADVGFAVETVIGDNPRDLETKQLVKDFHNLDEVDDKQQKEIIELKLKWIEWNDELFNVDYIENIELVRTYTDNSKNLKVRSLVITFNSGKESHYRVSNYSEQQIVNLYRLLRERILS